MALFKELTINDKPAVYHRLQAIHFMGNKTLIAVEHYSNEVSRNEFKEIDNNIKNYLTLSKELGELEKIKNVMDVEERIEELTSQVEELSLVIKYQKSLQEILVGTSMIEVQDLKLYDNITIEDGYNYLKRLEPYTDAEDV